MYQSAYVIGNKVVKDGVVYEVLDVGYLNPATYDPTTEKEGKLHYLLSDGQGWVPSEAIDHSAEGKPVNKWAWLDSLPPRTDNSKLPEIVAYLLAIQYDKEGFYGSSWIGKGEYRGVIANIDRKYDRLDNIIQDEIAGRRRQLPTTDSLSEKERKEIGESKIDAVADLANYAILYLMYLKSRHPGAFEYWLSRNLPDEYLKKIRESGLCN